jgi:hypothetical protein
MNPCSWRKFFRLFCALAFFAMGTIAHAAEHHGQVTFNNLPVPGAVVTASQGTMNLTAVTDQQGNYSFPDLTDGSWTIDVQMSFFSTLTQQIKIAPPTSGLQPPGLRWELKMLPLDQVMAKVKVVQSETRIAAGSVPPTPKPGAAKPAPVATMKPPDDAAPSSNDGFLVNGSVNNAATSQFTLAPGFGNTRKGTSSLYTGGLGAIIDQSSLDARPDSLTALNTPKAGYTLFTGVATFGGPLRIPHVLPRGPNFFLAYQWTRNKTASTLSALVPTIAQRDLTPIDPAAAALLALYPLPNIAGNSNYNYQTSILAGSNQDAGQLRLDKSIGRRDELYGNIAFQSRRSDNASLFHFHDTTDTLGLNLNANWQHRLNSGLFVTLAYHFSRLRTLVTPFFADKTNVEGEAGIGGTDEAPTDWGPPTLIFSSGIATLYDAQSAFNRDRTEGVSPSLEYYHGRHNVTLGADFRRQEFNYFTQQDPRGTFTFTGEASGVSDFQDFVNGKPDASSIAYGNADKYLRQSVYDAYATDDWRLRPDLTLNLGVRWEYGAPITELKNRLVNLDVAPEFTTVAPVLASDPTGPITGEHYPDSLLRPDRTTFEPRLGVSWRPIPGSSLVMRAGYGIYADTSVYQGTALQLAQQSPLSQTLSAQSLPGCPLTLATGLIPQECTSTTRNTFAVDPNFRVGYAQTWQVALQRDLPAALQVTATYLGVKGANGVQEFLPNTYPLGGTNPCPECPSGFVYRASNGTSNREAGSLQLRRRLRSGFTASLLYTYSRSIDDDAVLGGQGAMAAGAISQQASDASVAQNWLDLRAERGLSTFDQRNLLATTFQYSTGSGIGGGTLLGGWRGRVYKEWTVTGQIGAGSGLPETPVYLAATNGTGITGNLRPDRTGTPVNNQVPGRFLDAAAYIAPQPGAWGNAGRDSIRGPGTFTFNAALSRTFRIEKKYNLDIRVDATNLLNHVVYSSYNTTINPSTDSSSLGSPLFGLPVSANPMRSLQTTARLRF